MPNETTAAQLAKELADHKNIMEVYVLVKEVKLVLKVDDILFHPTIRVKIYTNMLEIVHPYHFEVSHTMHTPAQAQANVSSRTGAYSEAAALDTVISLFTTSIRDAVRLGHEPSDSWLLPNSDF